MIDFTNVSSTFYREQVHLIDNKIDNLSIKFENLSVLNKASVHMQEWVKEFLNSENIDYNSVCDEICQTITVYAEVLGEEVEELS